MGADVTHPGPTGGQDMRKSVAAVIGSITPDLMKYAAIVRQQDTTASPRDKATREVIDSMDTILYDLLDVSLLVGCWFMPAPYVLQMHFCALDLP